MKLNHLDIRDVEDGITCKVKVQPRASKNSIAGIVGNSLKLLLTSPPVDGEANEACVKFFAALCGVSKSKVTIISGNKNREKVLKIEGINRPCFADVLKSQFKFD